MIGAKAHGFFDIVKKRRSEETEQNAKKGVEIANQKEIFQTEPSAIAFVFILFSQAAQHRYFTSREFPFCIP